MLINELFYDISKKYDYNPYVASYIPDVAIIYRDKDYRYKCEFNEVEFLRKESVVLRPKFQLTNSRRHMVEQIINETLLENNQSFANIMSVDVNLDGVFPLPLLAKLYSMDSRDVATYIGNNYPINFTLGSYVKRKITDSFNIFTDNSLPSRTDIIKSNILNPKFTLNPIYSGKGYSIMNNELIDKAILIDLAGRTIIVTNKDYKIIHRNQCLLVPNDDLSPIEFGLIYVYLSVLINYNHDSDWVEEMINNDNLIIYYPYNDFNLMNVKVPYFDDKYIEQNYSEKGPVIDEN